MNSMMLDSPNINGPGSVPWGSLAQERSAISSSVGSVNMMGSESEGSESDEDASMGGDDNEDPIFTTPQVHKLQNPNAPTPINGPPTTPGGAAAWGSGNVFSPAQASLMKTIRRNRLHKSGKRSKKRSSSSASGSGYSSMASPRTTSPPPMRSIETAAGGNGGYFNYYTANRSRRESLALGTDGLHLSSGNDSGDEASLTAPSTPGVVRRPVVRRGNLLPKTKGFARVRAALLEESAPVDTEVRREAETMSQVRERDSSISELDLSHDRPQTATAQSSPNLLPAVLESAQEDFGHELEAESLNGHSQAARGLGMNFAAHASRNSGGMDYWTRFDPSTQRTPPPPPSNFLRQSSSMMSDISLLDSSDAASTPLYRRPRARSSASDASEAFVPPSQPQPAAMNDDMHLKKFKRRREDDFDIATIKRRAVSPGMSAQNSPVLTHSPSQKEANAAWGQPPERRREDGSSLPGSQNGQVSRQGSGGSLASMGTLTPVVSGGGPGGRKLGLQGMVDTNEGLMNMSLDT